ncbi:hypothetical protein V5799_022139 [Amblyomma americanum]|uniref:Cytochrome n=1 Tax=Amblyomma americanum TaxID=6943 RepID=A0AAQ4FNQ1_AMBAM
MMVDVTWAWAAAVLAALLYSLAHWLVRQRRKCFEAFEGTGIPTVLLRSLIKGNLDEFRKPNCIESLGRWLKEYGDVFGFFLGDTPFVVTKDLDMINSIFIKDSKKFHGRGHALNIYELDALFARFVGFSKGAIWKDSRNCMAQFFTPSKLKAVLPSLLNAEQEFIQILGEHADLDAETEINSLCERFTFDAIGKAAYGIDTDVQRNPENPLFKNALAVMPSLHSGFFYELGQSLYHCSWLLKVPLNLMKCVFNNPVSDLTQKAKDVIHYRQKNPQVNLPDMAQILLDGLACKNESHANMQGKKEENLVELPEETVNQLASNCMAVFIGGYDTTRLALTFWFYLMGRHPEIQEKMRHEVMKAFKEEGDNLSYRTLATLPYTNQVISETLRMYPPIITFTSRCVDEDYRHGAYLIKKGTSVMVPVYQLHHDPQYWNEPEKFDPDRFSPENKTLIDPVVYQPFGLGPRMCIGQRLALIEIASVTSQVLHHFRITLAPSQKLDLELDTCSFLAVPKEEVRIKLHRLKSDL